MKTSLLIIAASLVLTPLALAETELTDQRDKLSYSIGLQAGRSIKRRSFDVDPEILKAGIEDGLNGRKPRMEASEMQALMKSVENDIREKRRAARKADGEKNAVEGPKFLAENKTKDGVKTTASGLQYKILQEGTGPTPKENDRVVVNFIGMTIDGKEFENTHSSGHAETLPVDRMIKGWREGLQLMKVGSKFRLFVPADLAFGKLGAGAVAPNATLIFDMELLGIPETPMPTPVNARPMPDASASP